MTDPTNPTGPDGRTDAAWFRQHVDPILDAAPATDGWGAIEAGVLAQPAPRSATARRQRWLAAAAVLVVLAVTAVVVVAVRGGGTDDSDTVHAAGPHPDGWYVPVGLPAGWRLQSAVLTEGAPCDGASQRWKTLPEHAEDDGTRPALELRYHSCGTLPEAPGEPGPALGSGAIPSFVGPSTEEASWEVVRWEDDGLWELTGEGLSGDRLLAAAEAVVADPVSEAPPLPELDRTGGGSWQDVRPGSAPGVDLVVTSPAGEQVQYQLVVSGEGPALTPFTSDEAHPLPAQPLPLRRRGSIPMDRVSGSGALDAGYLFGGWPGADVLVPERVHPAPGADRPPSTADARAATSTVAGSLRRATTDEWRTFLATAVQPVADPALLAASSLAGLGAAPSRTTTTAPPDAPTATTSTAPGTDGGEATSEPATVSEPTDRQPREQYSDLVGLRVRLRLDTSTVGVATPTPGALLVENTTSKAITINECSSLLTRWGLLPRGERGQLPRRLIIDCFDTPTTTIEAGGQTVVPLEWGVHSGFAARSAGNDPGSPYLGTLPGGRYTAIAVIPGRTGDIRLEVPVTVLPPVCPMTDEEAMAYRDLTTAEAEAAAQRDGRHIAVVSTDGEAEGTEWNLDCTRVRAHIGGGRVMDYTFG